ncbi:MAG: hypothetical protein HFJ08_14655 [Lachnospiraceae bacterium]|nr:hypothetical protein [Lachnospiraceae bacterium]
MNNTDKQSIHMLFEVQNYAALYSSYSEVIHQMLLIENQQDFADFIENEPFLEEDIFFLYYDAVNGESLFIGGYDNDVTEKVRDFLKQKLPEDLFSAIQKCLQNIYVDIDEDDTLEKTIALCNQHLENTGYIIQTVFDDTYCAGGYFLSVQSGSSYENLEVMQ